MHVSALQSPGIDPANIMKGDRLTFDVESTRDGKTRASNVRHGPPKGWWTVKRNGLPIRHFPGKEKAERYATDPEYRASLVQ
jgi:hypothetical protein